MIIKKFEARSMKEALEMIKSELGPEAIIIAARDNIKNYGLVGDESVEITAAIQEDRLQKKKLAESRMTAELRDRIHKGSAKNHKELIEKVIQNRQKEDQKNNSPSKPLVATAAKTPARRSQRYIDMLDEVEPEAAPNGASERLKIEAQKAWKTLKQSATPNNASSLTLHSLKDEIHDLKQFFTSLRNVPQNIIPAHPGHDFGLRYELSSFYEKLLATGIEKNLLVTLLKQVQDDLLSTNTLTTPFIHGMIAKTLAQKIIIKPPGSDFKLEVFIGAGGHGKTSSLIKRASALSLSEQKRVAILSTDTKKLGADEQLKIYSQILNIPFMPIHSSSDWAFVANEIRHFDHILIDTPGVRFRSPDEIQELKKRLPSSSLNCTTHLVLSATAKDQDAIEIGKRFTSVGFDDIIFTALDESLQHGVLLNFQNFIGKPFHSFGIGPKIPEDFEPATIERVVDLFIGAPMIFDHNAELGI